MRYVHHRPGADDAARLSRAFRGERDAYPEPYPEMGESGRTESN